MHTMDTSIIFLFSALLVTSSGCGENTPSPKQGEVRLKISHYKVPCTGADLQLCLLVSTNGNDPEYFYDTIEGFEYEWGYDYEISVEKNTLERPMADASSNSYKLKQVLKKERVALETTFELPVNLDEMALVENTDAGCMLMGEIAIDPGKFTCENLANAQRAVFRHGTGNGSLLVVELK